MLTSIALAALGWSHAGDGLRMVEVPLSDSPPVQTLSPAFPHWFEYVLGPFDPGFEWDEMVPSWILKTADRHAIRVEAGFDDPSGNRRWYDFGHWSQFPSAPRMSSRNVKDELAEVQTDTLLLPSPRRQIWIRLGVGGPTGATPPPAPRLFLAFRNSKIEPSPRPANRRVWGKQIEVPMRSQMSYEGGNVLCSPTCVSMMLAHWANQTGDKELDRDVPEVAAGVFDPNWPGTGNWPFNTAFAAAHPSMTAYVSRLGSIAELEDWIEAGIPVTTSVSYALLKGRPKKEPNDGHLVVLIGFDKAGNPVFNDPGRSTEVRQTYQREDFAKAWKTSGNTVYLIYPEAKPAPENRLGHWLD